MVGFYRCGISSMAYVLFCLLLVAVGCVWCHCPFMFEVKLLVNIFQILFLGLHSMVGVARWLSFICWSLASIGWLWFYYLLSCVFKSNCCRSYFIPIINLNLGLYHLFEIVFDCLVLWCCMWQTLKHLGCPFSYCYYDLSLELSFFTIHIVPICPLLITNIFLLLFHL